MKKIGLILLSALTAAFILPSCNDSDGDYASYKAFVTVHAPCTENFFFQLDNKKTANPGDTRRISGYEPVDGQRAIILFNYMDEKAPGSDYNIAVYAIADILTKAPKTVATQEELDEIGDDRLDITVDQTKTRQIWIGGGHLNINFGIFGYTGSTHVMNLIVNNVGDGEAETDGYTNVEFRQKASNSGGNNYLTSWVSFRLGDLDPAVSGSKGLNVRVKTLSGEIKYYKVEPQKAEE